MIKSVLPTALMGRGGNIPLVAPQSSDELTPPATVIERAAYLLFIVYFMVGTFGRFPWKADEPYSFSMVWNILNQGLWLVPHVGGDPFLEKPPLMFWLGAVCARLLPWAPPYESSRLAVLLCLALTFWAYCRAAACLYAEHYANNPRGPAYRYWRLTAVCLLAGSIGLAEHAHKFTADLGQLAGAALALTALMLLAGGNPSATETGRSSCLKRFPFKVFSQGLLFGLGVGMAFLSKGLLVPGIIGITLFFSMMLLPDITRRVWGVFLLGALAAALPFVLPWPWALYRFDPDLFHEWFWVNNIGRFSGVTQLGGHDNPLSNRMLSLLVNGAPASLVLLAAMAAWFTGVMGRIIMPNNALRRAKAHSLMVGWRMRPAYAVAGLFTAVGVTVLCASGSMRDIYLLPLYPAMALLALPMMAKRRGITAARRALDVVFGAVLIVIAATWYDLARGAPPALLLVIWPHAPDQLPLPFTLSARPMAVIAACGVTALWGLIVGARRGVGVVLAWASGLVMLWSVVFLLLMPWIDAARSFKDTLTPLKAHLDSSGCLATDGLGESELGLLHYLTGKKGIRIYAGHSGSGDGVTPNPAAAHCPLLLVNHELSDGATPPSGRWVAIWQGGRPADTRLFILYRLARPDEEPILIPSSCRV